MIALARQEMGAKSGPARAQEVRANAKATPPSGGSVGAIDEPHRPTFEFGATLQPASERKFNTFFGLMHWRYDESDDGN